MKILLFKWKLLFLTPYLLYAIQEPKAKKKKRLKKWSGNEKYFNS